MGVILRQIDFTSVNWRFLPVICLFDHTVFAEICHLMFGLLVKHRGFDCSFVFLVMSLFSRKKNFPFCEHPLESAKKMDLHQFG